MIGIKGLHNWRSCFDLEMSKAKYLENELRKRLEKKLPKTLKLILEGSAGCLTAPFAQFFLSAFTSDLPYQLSMRLFEVFLLYGEDFMLDFLYKCIKVSDKKLSNDLIDEEVIRYIKSYMIEECFNLRLSIKNIIK